MVYGVFLELGKRKVLVPLVVDHKIFPRRAVWLVKVSASPSEKPNCTEPDVRRPQLAHVCPNGLSGTGSQLMK